MLSSIFSSEKSYPTKGKPLAVGLALLFLAAFEIVLHFVPAENLIGYGTGLGAYYEIRHSIEEFGGPDVAVIGSSRGRESLLMPMLAEQLSTLSGREISVGNYSCPDGKAEELDLITAGLISSKHKPEILIYFLSSRIFQGNEPDPQRQEIFGVFPNQFGAKSQHYLAKFSEKPTWNFRNWLGRNYLTFRHRYRFRYLLESMARNREPVSPIRGQLTKWQKFTPGRSLENHPLSDAAIKDYVNRLLDEKGNYELGLSRVSAFKNTVRLCRENDVSLVVVAAPISEPLLRHYPPSLIPDYLDLVERLEKEEGFHVTSLEELGITLDNKDFREQSHLNYLGAEKLTREIGEKLVFPQLVKSARSRGGSPPNH